jgi:hypothetical protein
MLGFFRKSPHPRQPTAALAQALVRDGLPAGLQPAALLVAEESGLYCDRQVRYFRVYDPVRVGERTLHVGSFKDLDAHPDLVVGSGHMERNGTVVLSKPDQPLLASTLVRNEADRTAHSDDDGIVFPKAAAVS